MTEQQGALYGVVLAGGTGTRLWPLSRAGHPKFLHPLTGTDASLLQATVARLDLLSPSDRILVVTGVAHAAAVSRQLTSIPDENVLVEPSPRDSCAAIALAAAVIARRDPEAIMGSFASDHLIADKVAFTEVIKQAMACATPVLTTPRLSLPEVGGDAVAYTTEDPDRIATDLADLLHDEQRRLTLAKAGFDRAKEFTWASSAEVHVTTWKRVADA